MGRSVAEIVHLLLAGGWRRRFLICTPILLLPPIGFGVGLFAPKTYETHMTILVQELAKQSPYLGDLTVSTRLQERMPVLMSLVRNATSLENVAASLGLISEETPKGERDAVVARLSKGLTMQLIGADLVELRLRADSASRLIDKLNQIGKKFIERLTAPERSSISDSVEFLERQIDNRRTLLKTAQLRLSEFRSRNGSLLPEVRAENIQRLAKLKQSLEDRRIALAGASATVEELHASIFHTNPVLEQMDKDIARLSFELAQLEARYTQQHPSLNAKRRELHTLEEQRQRFGANITPDKSEKLAGAEPRAWSARRRRRP